MVEALLFMYIYLIDKMHVRFQWTLTSISSSRWAKISEPDDVYVSDYFNLSMSSSVVHYVKYGGAPLYSTLLAIRHYNLSSTKNAEYY